MYSPRSLFFALIVTVLSPAHAGQWGGSVSLESAYNQFEIKYPNRSDNGIAGLEATFQNIALTGVYTSGRNSYSVKLSGAEDPDLDQFYGGSGNWDSNGNPCTPSTCPQSAERSEFTVTYSRSLENGFSLFGGFYQGEISWTEKQGRASREAAGIFPRIENICGNGGVSVETTTIFQSENFGLFLGGAYSRALSDRFFGTIRFASVFDAEADVSEEYDCAGGIAPYIRPTGTLFNGTANSVGLSLFYPINNKSGLNFAYDTKSYSFDDGKDYWSGGTARTEESLDITSFSYIFNF